jgi:hypothetical protein
MGQRDAAAASASSGFSEELEWCGHETILSGQKALSIFVTSSDPGGTGKS